MQHRIHLTATEPNPLGTLFQGRNLTLGHGTVGLRQHHKVVQQLQPLRVVHLLVDLSATLTDGLLELRPTLALLLIEEFVQDIITLIDGLATEILSEHLTYRLHLGMHGLAIGLDDIGRQYEQRKQETIALSLLLTLTVGLLIGLTVILIRLLLPILLALGTGTPCAGIGRRVDTIEYRVKERAYQITRQSAQRTSGHPSDKTTYPLTCCHNLLILRLPEWPRLYKRWAVGYATSALLWEQYL